MGMAEGNSHNLARATSPTKNSIHSFHNMCAVNLAQPVQMEWDGKTEATVIDYILTGYINADLYYVSVCANSVFSVCCSSGCITF